MQQYNPYQPSTSNIPPQTIPKTNWALYTITIIISIVILLLLNGGLTLSASFLGLTSFTTLFVFISLISLVIGLISGFILNKIAKSNKSFLLGTSITSFLCATMVSIYLSVQKKLAEKFVIEEISPYYIPVTILQDRNISVLENVVSYLKDTFGLSYHKIALLLNRDDRTIWTVYQRAIKKRKHAG